MPGPFQRLDLLGEQADITERVRKLEVMPHSRSLKPRIWQPDKSQADVITGLLHIAFGVGSGERIKLGAVAHELFYLMDTKGIPPDTAGDLYRLSMHCGMGPRFTGANLYTAETGLSYADLATRYPETWGPAAGYPSNYAKAWLPVGGSGNDWKRAFAFTRLPTAPPSTFPASWKWAPSGSTFHNGQEVPTGPGTGFLLAEHFPESEGEASDHYYVQPGWWASYDEDRVVERTNTYPVGENLLDCGGPELSPMWQGGYPVVYDTDPNGPCPNNPFSTGATGSIFKNFVINEGNAPDLALAPLVVAEGGEIAGPIGGAPDWDLVVERVGICRDLGIAPAIFAWCDAYIPIAQSTLTTHENEGWQRLPLFPGWWGRLDVRYNERTVFFRGRVRCLSETPGNSRIAFYPYDLPIGNLANPGTYLQCHLEDGTPINCALTHALRGAPDSYDGSMVEYRNPNLGAGGVAWAGGQEYWEINFDGANFARFSGG